MDINYISLGERIRFIRQSKKITQKLLSEMIHISVSYISHIENGSKTMSLSVFVSIANALDVSADDLLVESLTSPSKAFDKGIISIFSGCTEAEMRFLLHSMKEIKKALREYEKQRPTDKQKEQIIKKKRRSAYGNSR